MQDTDVDFLKNLVYKYVSPEVKLAVSTEHDNTVYVGGIGWVDIHDSTLRLGNWYTSREQTRLHATSIDLLTATETQFKAAFKKVFPDHFKETP
jgi:hypothetical protein